MEIENYDDFYSTFDFLSFSIPKYMEKSYLELDEILERFYNKYDFHNRYYFYRADVL